MPRKGHVAKRDVLADPIYNSKLVTRLINRIMIDGKEELLNQFYIKHSKLLRKKQENQQWKYLKQH